MASVDVMDRIRKLDEERSSLVAEAKAQALSKAREAIEELGNLGFSYSIIEGAGDSASPAGKGLRRSGIRDEVMGALRACGGTGANRGELLDMLGVKGQRKGEQSVSNALSSLKKAGKLQQKNGRYIAN